MNRKQYEVVQDVVVFSKYFADEVRKILENNGLLQEGFALKVEVGVPYQSPNGTDYDCFVELEKDTKCEDWFQTSTARWRTTDGEWENHGDSIIDVYSTKSKGNAKKAVHSGTEKAEKPYPPDGLWIGLDYADPHVDGGM